MGENRDSDPWIEDFSYVLTRDTMRRERSDYKYEVFAGSKPLAWLWLALVAIIGGALGGTMVSGALWGSFLYVPLWLAATVASCIAIYRSTSAVSGSPLGFLAGWCFFWGMLIGACTLWGAQLSGTGWAYGIAGGVGFLIGITQGVREPEDIESHELFFAIGMLTAPLGACGAAWLYRNVLGDPSLTAAAVSGAVSGVIFLAPVMAMQFKQQDSIEGLKRVARLLLHRDENAIEAIPVLDSAIGRAPNDASLFDLRALAHALAGNGDAAEEDWRWHSQLAPKSGSPDISRGWVHLRRGRAGEAAGSFEAALSKSKRDFWALIGLGLARLQMGDAMAALGALSKIPQSRLDALSLTHLAEAQLVAGQARSAIDLAGVAIDELDSIFGRTWLVRAEAKRTLGDIDGAERDYNRAWHTADEEGIQERALVGLDLIERPINEDGPE